MQNRAQRFHTACEAAAALRQTAAEYRAHQAPGPLPAQSVLGHPGINVEALFGVPPCVAAGIEPSMLAVCMCMHPRLGRASPLRMMDSETLRAIVREYEREALPAGV